MRFSNWKVPNTQYSRISNGQDVIHLTLVYMWKRLDQQALCKCLFLYPDNKESIEQCRCLYYRCLKLDVNKIFTSGLGCLDAINAQNSFSYLLIIMNLALISKIFRDETYFRLSFQFTLYVVGGGSAFKAHFGHVFKLSLIMKATIEVWKSPVIKWL